MLIFQSLGQLYLFTDFTQYPAVTPFSLQRTLQPDFCGARDSRLSTNDRKGHTHRHSVGKRSEATTDASHENYLSVPFDKVADLHNITPCIWVNYPGFLGWWSYEIIVPKWLKTRWARGTVHVPFNLDQLRVGRKWETSIADL